MDTTARDQLVANVVETVKLPKKRLVAMGWLYPTLKLST